MSQHSVEQPATKVFDTGVDFVDGTLNGFAEIWRTREQVKLAEAQARQEAARREVPVQSRTEAQPGVNDWANAPGPSKIVGGVRVRPGDMWPLLIGIGALLVLK